MSDRDLLIEIRNDSKHTKASVDKLWKRTDEFGKTMSELSTTVASQGNSIDTMTRAVFTDKESMSTRVSVLESRKPSGSSGLHSIRVPAPVAQALDANKVVKMLGSLLLAVITGVGTYFATK